MLWNSVERAGGRREKWVKKLRRRRKLNNVVQVKGKRVKTRNRKWHRGREREREGDGSWTTINSSRVDCCCRTCITNMIYGRTKCTNAVTSYYDSRLRLLPRKLQSCLLPPATADVATTITTTITITDEEEGGLLLLQLICCSNGTASGS